MSYLRLAQDTLHNMAIAQKGLDEKLGTGLGAAMNLLMEKGEM